MLYVVRRGERNEELRHSLRSLANLPHDTVHIAGHTSTWVKNVNSIYVSQYGLRKNEAAKNNLIEGLKRISIDRVAIFNDDFFVMNPVTELQWVSNGDLERVARVRKSVYPHSRYTKATFATLGLLKEKYGIIEAYNFDTHRPQVFDRELLLDLLQDLEDPLIHWRTIYGNITGQTPVFGSNAKNPPEFEGRDFLSTNDITWKRQPIGKYVRKAFPDPGKYEL